MHHWRYSKYLISNCINTYSTYSVSAHSHTHSNTHTSPPPHTPTNLMPTPTHFNKNITFSHTLLSTLSPAFPPLSYLPLVSCGGKGGGVPRARRLPRGCRGLGWGSILHPRQSPSPAEPPPPGVRGSWWWWWSPAGDGAGVSLLPPRPAPSSLSYPSFYFIALCFTVID